MSKEILEYLEELISDKEDAKMVVEGADIPVNRIDFNAAPRKMWYRIISETKKYKNGMQRILQSALAEYPQDEFLQNEINKLGGTPAKKNNPSIEVPVQISEKDKMALKEMIGQNKLQEVFDQLKQYNEQFDSEQQNELVTLISRNNAYRRDSRMAGSSASELEIRRNKLILFTMEFIDSI